MAQETVFKCCNCKKTFGSEELSELVPRCSKFGFDVIVYVGMSLFVNYRSEEEVQKQLCEHNIKISRSEIGYLGKKFITYLALAHRESQPHLKNLIAEHGGYVLHLDATCEGDSPQLMSALDDVSKLILGNVKLPSEKAEQIVPFLSDLRRDFGDPVAIVRDMGSGIASASFAVFPGVPSFICHFHFLRDIGKDLFAIEYDALHRGLKRYTVRSLLRKLIKRVRHKIDKDLKLKAIFEAYMQSNKNGIPSETLPPLIIAYTLGLWILNAKNQCNGYGFPFDQPHLYTYQRMNAVKELIKRLKTKKVVEQEILAIDKIISNVLNDHILKRTILKIQEKIFIFDKLRSALRIASPTGTSSLKDNGDNCDIKTIEQEVSVWFKEFKQSPNANELCYKRIIKQVTKYWDNLFSKPILVQGKNGAFTIQPQRTNNILETFFRDLKRGYRRKSGNQSLNQTIKTMLAQTPLVKNLNNLRYQQVLLNGKNSLAARFADIDATLVQKHLAQHYNSAQRLPAPLAKILKFPDLPTKIIQKQKLRIAA